MKKILGIAAFLAVVALGLTFTACPADNDERSITFTNKTSSPINITFQNAPKVELAAKSGVLGQDESKTVTMVGKDFILLTIVFTKTELQDYDMDYIFDNFVSVTGALVAGNKKVEKGIALGYGDMIFSPKNVDGTNPAGFNKISTIPQDE